jgi:hypothetical protein
MGEHRVAKRIRRRVACELQAEGHRQRAIVLDVSRTGLFVQTSARLRPGTPVELSLQFEGGTEPIPVRAAVARQKAVPSTLTSVAQGGVGLRILDAPPAYYEQIGEPPPPPRHGAPPRPAAPAGAAPVRLRFRVRVKQSDGPRSRVVDVLEESAERACAAALAQLGAGWEALGAERA